MEEIKLFNRDGANLKLVSKDGQNWNFSVDDGHKFVLEYMRLGLGDDKESITFADPSGGPMLSIGQRISNEYVIESITFKPGERITIKTFKSQA